MNKSNNSRITHHASLITPHISFIYRSKASTMKSSYRILIAERLDPAWSGWLHKATIMPIDDGATMLQGLADEPETLKSVLSRLRELGATLLAVETAEATHNHASKPNSTE